MRSSLSFVLCFVAGCSGTAGHSSLPDADRRDAGDERGLGDGRVDAGIDGPMDARVADGSVADSAVDAGPRAPVPRVIFDSDMSSDWDDIGDIGVLHGLASLGELDIIGMMNSSQNGATPLCMDAINTWYGQPDIPIGRRPDIGGAGGYPAQIAGEYPHGPETSGTDFPLAVDLYRQLLAASPDHSVVIVIAGYLNNLSALLQSGPDAYSPLSGAALVAQKVSLLACAGGQYPSGAEFNFGVEAAAAYYVVNNWPAAVTYTGFELGNQIRTGSRLPEARPDSPIRRVYVGIENNYPYPSWTQIAMYQAFRTDEHLFDVQNVGRNNANRDGSNFWTSTPDPTGDAEQAYILERMRVRVIEALDALMNLAPDDGTPSVPGWPSDLRATVVGGNRVDLQWADNAFDETGFVIERRDATGAYAPIGTVGANATRYSDTGLSSTANLSYRVKARNATGDSSYATVWIYSGWTEFNFGTGGTTPSLYAYYQDNLRWARGGDFRPDHVVLNNDSMHGQTLTVDVDVSAEGEQGSFYVYFFYQDPNNWYRLTVDETHCLFEKRVAGTTSQIGASAANSNIGSGSGPNHWRLTVTPAGRLQFTRSIVYGSAPEIAMSTVGTLLDVTAPLVFANGRVGLGGNARTPVWENFTFATR